MYILLPVCLQLYRSFHQDIVGIVNIALMGEVFTNRLEINSLLYFLTLVFKEIVLFCEQYLIIINTGQTPIIS